MLPKTEFTSLDTAAVVRELEIVVPDCHVSNVYQLDAKTLLFKLHKPGKPDLRLVLEAGKRIHLTSYALEIPMTPPTFCMALRKYLRMSLLKTVEQYEFERIISLGFKSKFGVVRLILELFGEGNFILVDEKNAILQALSYKRMRDRNILRGEAFTLPPAIGVNPLKISQKEFGEGLETLAKVEVVRALARILGIGGFYAEEVLLRAEVDKARACALLGESEVSTIFGELQKMISQVTAGELQPHVVIGEDGRLADTVPIKLKCYEGLKLQPHGSFNEALDEFYTQTRELERMAAKVDFDELEREAKRLSRIISEQEKTLIGTEAEVERNKHVGDAIYAHFSELQTLLDRFLKAKKTGKSWNTIFSETLAEQKADLKSSLFFASFDEKKLMINVDIDGVAFGIELQRTLFENAARYYESSKRAKQKSAGARKALQESNKKLVETKREISEAESLRQAKPVETAEKLAKLRVKRKEWFEKFRWFVSSEGILVVGGKDIVSNEILIKKHAEKNDIVFHADIAGAPFVIVKTEGKKSIEKTLCEAGEFAAAFCRGWREGFGSVDVYWVDPGQLRKGGPSGEYVPRGAFVVTGRRNWIRNVPLRVAIGVAEKNGDVAFLGGPIDAVESKTKACAIVVPGDMPSGELFRCILHSLAQMMPPDLREKVLKTSVERLRNYVPYGRGRMLIQ